jgi:hypothetical protein
MKLKTTALLLTAGLISGVVIYRQLNHGVLKEPTRTPLVTKRTVVAAKPQVPSQIEMMSDESLHWEERIKAVRDLPDSLSQASLARLFAYLQEPPESGRESWYLVCNEIMETLRKRNLAPETYTPTLLGIIQSSAFDPVIRDYAVQHLCQWISGIDPSARETHPAQASTAFEALSQECLKPENGEFTLTGTTLNALLDAVLNGTEDFTRKRLSLASLALQLVNQSDGSVSTLNRATALQVAARLKLGEIPALCRKLALDSQVAPNLRFSSIAALGEVGGEQDIELLQSFVNDETYKFAASAALNRVISATTQP